MTSFLLILACATTPDTGTNSPADTAPDTADTSAFECPYNAAEIDNECAECIDEKCADLFPFCHEYAECECMEACLRKEGMGEIETCLATLGLEYRPIGFAQLEECVAYSCPDSDECSTPNDWTPPDAEIECDGTGTGSLGSGNEADCGFDLGLEFDPEGEVLQLLSADGDFCVRIERTSDGAGTLENVTWTLNKIQVGPLGEVATVNATDEFCWYSSHHNFQDWAHVWTGSRRYDLGLKEDGHGGPRRYHLYVFEEGPVNPDECGPTAFGSVCIEGPIALYPYEP